MFEGVPIGRLLWETRSRLGATVSPSPLAGEGLGVRGVVPLGERLP